MKLKKAESQILSLHQVGIIPQLSQSDLVITDHEKSPYCLVSVVYRFRLIGYNESRLPNFLFYKYWQQV